MKTKTRISLMLALALIMCMFVNTAFACTSIYVGSSLTADGTTIFGRSEDYSNSQNKLFYVSPAGNHTAGELYNGCYGFSYTFTHDSYGYTAFRDDNGDAVDNVCPDCDDDHAHTPYEAAGTNDQGLTVTATETIHGSEKIEEVDPYEDLGIEEAEIVTVLLSEAATAREALALLTSIYDEAGANGGSGIIIADNTEAWYIENVSGHQYIAVKLNDTITLVQPNMVIIGEIDLDDTDNVVASAGIIDVATQAGTLVGDADANIINYVYSYCEGTTANARMLDALPYLNAEFEGITEEDGTEAYLITNLDENGDITAMHTGITPDRAITIEDVQDFYKISTIGTVRCLETHIFQLYGGDTATDTVEWVSMDDPAINVFVPYYPMLTTSVEDGYMLSTATAEFVEEEPESGLYYPTSITRRVDGERVTVEGYRILPENWADSMYWSYDALSNILTYCDVDTEKAEVAMASLADKQAAVNQAFAEFQAGLTEEELTDEELETAATLVSAIMAADTHSLAIELVNGLIGE